MTAPDAPQREHVHTEHGVERVDPYYWMRDREDPEVIAYIEAENAYTQDRTAHLEGLRKTLYDEILGRIQEDDTSVPVKRGEYYYYSRTVEGKSYPIYCRKQGSEEGEEEVLLDMNELGAQHEYVSLGAYTVSPDHKWLAYSIDITGREKYTLHFKNLETGEHSNESIEAISPNTVWAKDSKTLFYTTLDETLRPATVHRHVLGADPTADEVVATEEDEKFRIWVGKTLDEAYMVTVSMSSTTSEYQVLSGDAPEGDFEVLIPRQQGVEYHASHRDGSWYLMTNYAVDADGKQTQDAINFRLLELADGKHDLAEATEVVAHRPDVHLLGVEVFQDFMVLSEREAGVRQLRIQPFSDDEPHLIAFPESAFVARLGSNPEFATGTLRLTYTSMVTPQTTYDYDVAAKALTLRKQQPVLGGFNAENYVSSKVWATAEDGTKVPVSVVHHKDVDPKANNPFLLYGYGSYGIPTEPTFSLSRLSLLDRGVVFGIAHIRGSGDLGRPWYEDGKFLHKRNTFTDFIAVAKHLIEEGYTTSDKLGIYGGSAGGLLMGAVINMEPELFKVSVAAVPFVDVVTTMLDESIPLTTGEWEEWGDPRDKTYFDYMLSYSPYDNVDAKNYPHLLITSGLNDPRVQYWEPTKWAAKLRDVKVGDNEVLLKTEMGAGHGGKSGRFGWIEDTAFTYAFVLDKLGVAAPE